LRRLECADTDGVEVALAETKPDAVVFAAGWSWVDGCEGDPARAFAENAEQPARVAKLCAERRIRFAYFSSSYVFDGVSGPYTECDSPAPINVYGRAKLEGERLIHQLNPGALLLRVICVYGSEAQKKNFAYQVLKAMREGRVLRLPSDQEGNPTFAGDIARWSLALLETKAAGVWHLGGPWPDCKRQDWAGKMVSAFQESGIKAMPGFSIQTIPTAELKQRALRPLKAGLRSEKITALGMPPTEFGGTIRELMESER